MLAHMCKLAAYAIAATPVSPRPFAPVDEHSIYSSCTGSNVCSDGKIELIIDKLSVALQIDDITLLGSIHDFGTRFSHLISSSSSPDCTIQCPIYSEH
jgi:hypothetical protein